MPEQAVEIITSMAGDLKAKTDEALNKITGGGFNDPDFDKSLQAAIDKDLGKAPSEPEPEPEPEKVPVSQVKEPAKEAKPDVKPSIVIPDDLPPELLGEKPPDKKQPDADAAKAEAERLKYIEEQTKGMTPKAAERFKKIEMRAFEAEQQAKKLAQEKEAQVAALQKEIQSLAMKSAEKKEEPAEVQALKKQLEEYEAYVSKVALQEDPRFKAAYDGKIASEIEKAKSFVPQEYVDEVTELLSIPQSKRRDARLDEIAEEIGGIPGTKLRGVVDRIDNTASEKMEKLKNWREERVHVDAKILRDQEAEKASLAEKQQLAWAEGISSVTSPETGLEVFRKAEGNEEWNAKVEARLANVKNILASEIKPSQIVQLTAKAVAADDYRRMFLAQRVLVQKLTQELAEFKKTEPNPGAGSAQPASVNDNRSFVDAAVDEAVKAGGLRA